MAAEEPGNFFKQKRNTAEIKLELLTQFFNRWCLNLLTDQDKPQAEPLLFIDLHTGQGYDKIEQPTAPVKILQSISESSGANPDLNKTVKTFFNDSSGLLTDKLAHYLESMPWYQHLTHFPVYLNNEEAQEQLTGLLNQQYQSLLFVDPFSYGYAQQLLLQAVQQGQPDLFMVFDFKKVRPALLDEETGGPMHQLLGYNLDQIKDYYRSEKSTRKREQFLINKLETVFRENGYYTFSFRIDLPDKEQTSNYLLLISKAKANYFAIKELMQPYSDYQEDGVPLFGANLKYQPPLLPGFFRYLHPYCLENLIEDLANKRSQYHYRTIAEIYEEHSIGTNYIKENYRAAFEKLREQGHINIVDTSNRKVKQITDSAVIFYRLHATKVDTGTTRAF